MSQVVSKEQATKEVNAWLDFQCVSEDDRALFKNSVSKLVNAVCAGMIVIDESNFQLTQKLKFPFGNEVKITELVYKPSITVGEVKQASAPEPGEEANADGGVYGPGFSYIKALTGQHKAITGRMNDKDYKISDAIVLFFTL